MKHLTVFESAKVSSFRMPPTFVCAIDLELDPYRGSNLGSQIYLKLSSGFIFRTQRIRVLQRIESEFATRLSSVYTPPPPFPKNASFVHICKLKTIIIATVLHFFFVSDQDQGHFVLLLLLCGSAFFRRAGSGPTPLLHFSPNPFGLRAQDPAWGTG